MKTFRRRILLLIIGLIVLVQAATVTAVLLVTLRDSEARAREELHSTGNVVEQAINSRGAELASAVQILASDFGFREAVASQDRPTILSALDNHGARIKANLTLLLSLDGHVIASTQAGMSSYGNGIFSDLVHSAGERGSELTYVVLDGRAYQLVIAAVPAPTTIAWVVMGFELDTAVANNLKRRFSLDVAFAGIHRPAGVPVVATFEARSPEAFEPEVKRALDSRNEVVTISAADETYFALAVPLAFRPGSPFLVVARSMHDVQAAYRQVRAPLVLISAIAMLLAIVVGIVLAGSVTRPVTRLVTAARRIESGDYTVAVPVRTSDEFGTLSKVFNSMQSGIAEREARLLHQATHDALTGLPNRLMAAERLGVAILRARATNASIGLLLLDIKDFERINASLGHSIGDEVLCELGRRLRSQVNTADTVARVGVAQFLMLLENSSHQATLALARQLCDTVRAGILRDDVQVSLMPRVGICLFPDHGETAGELLRRTETALYDSHESDEAVTEYQTGRDEGHRRQIALVGALRRAIANNELTLLYQPKVEIASRKVKSLEALARWFHSTHGFIPPAEFIPYAERTGSIGLLTRWVVQNAVRQCRHWADQGLDAEVSVNLSAADLHDRELAAMIIAELQQQQVDPTRLVLEITETAAMRETAGAIRVMEELRTYGVRFSIDDFGTGFSSLVQLKRLPVDEIKIDKSFVLDLKPDTDDAVIVKSTIDLGHSMGLKVVAEGVDKAESWQFLAQLGCDLAQGYFVSHPLKADDVAAWVMRLNAKLETASSATAQVRVIREHHRNTR
ncbi:MAG TPA: EAL domain-containing protein [Steroidobacteraceae bacterium]|nr:EAL domain-containing protein [Steroidobacteraceae bacterium]